MKSMENNTQGIVFSLHVDILDQQQSSNINEQILLPETSKLNQLKCQLDKQHHSLH